MTGECVQTVWARGLSTSFVGMGRTSVKRTMTVRFIAAHQVQTACRLVSLAVVERFKQQEAESLLAEAFTLCTPGRPFLGEQVGAWVARLPHAGACPDQIRPVQLLLPTARTPVPVISMVGLKTPGVAPMALS